MYAHRGQMTLTSKFEPLIHKWDCLNELTDDDQSKPMVAELIKDIKCAESGSLLAPLKNAKKLHQARSDLIALLAQVKTTPGLEDYFNGRSSKNNVSISFDYLWTIFPAGELVFAQPNDGQPQVFIVKASDDYIDEIKRKGTKSWSFVCWSYD